MANEIPVNEVRMLSSQGRSEREIIHELKSKGYSNESISKALAFSLKEQSQRPQSPQPAQQASSEGQSVSKSEATYALPKQPPLPTMESQEYSQIPYGQSEQQEIPMTMEEEIQLEELIEEILNEKWEDVRDSLIEWDRQISVVAERMDQIEDRMKDLEVRHDAVREDIKDMLGTSTEHLQVVEGRIGSIEKVFKEFMPSLTESVRSLSSSVERMDTKPSSQKTSDKNPKK